MLFIEHWVLGGMTRFTTTMLTYVMEQLIEESPPYPDAQTNIPKYKFPEVKLQETESTETLENANNTTESGNQDIDKLRVNLFSGWGEDSSKAEDNIPDKMESNSQDVVVNYSSDISSEVEMLDSSTAHIEYKNRIYSCIDGQYPGSC